MENQTNKNLQLPIGLVQWLLIAFGIGTGFMLGMAFIYIVIPAIFAVSVSIYDAELFINPGSGMALLSLLIWGYWRQYLRGTVPVEGTPVDANIYRYFSYAGRRIWWKAVTLANQQGEQLNAKYIFQALATHSGVQLSLLRMGVTDVEVYQVLATDDLTLEEILTTSLSFAVSEDSHISWDDLWRALISRSANIKTLLTAKDISVDEAVGAINWSRSDIYRTSPRRQMFADIFSPNRNLNRTWTARPTPTLERFSQDLTELARLGQMTSAKVREQEVDQAIQILSKSSENNLILVGEAGVGKTSVVGDIARLMAENKLVALRDHKLISLDVNAIIGTGEDFQAIFTRAIEEASMSGNTILFIGNLDQFGKVRSASGFDLSAILLSALENKNLQLIGTSDQLNFKKYIANNTNFAQYFTTLQIEELSKDESVLVLQEIAAQIERRQGVVITLAAIKSAVELSSKLIHTSMLPAKAEQLLDESAVFAARHGQSVLDAGAIQQVMSTKTNVPVGEVTGDEKIRLAALEHQMGGRVIGQEQAVTAVVSALQRARLGIAPDSNKPIGSFLFLGPTGVGKTETAKALAGAYFGDDTKMIRLDMSEYQTRESIYKLIGAPSTSGDAALSGGQFTEMVKATPFAVVLLDEIEKASPDVLNLFLSVLDEGFLTDSLGSKVSFAHTIIIATSNAQAQFIQQSIASGMEYADIKEGVTERLTQTDFKPEFINRFDGMIVFKPLTQENILAIAKIKVNKLVSHLKIEKGLDLQVTDAALAQLAKLGYDPAFGARSLERVIREHLENFVARKLLEPTPVSNLLFDVEDIR